MSETVRLAVIGGSGASTPELIDAVAGWPGGADRRPRLEIVLQGRTESKLRVVADACRQRLPDDVKGVVMSTEPDLERALDGADVVLIQVRIGGLDARVFDETFPREWGIPGEETMGPGGFANAMRTVPALASLWDALASAARDAFIVNLTNPSGIVSQAATAHTGLRILSVCDGPVSFVDGIAAATGRAAEDVRQGYGGLNHVGFWSDGDVGVMRSALPATKGIDAADVENLGALPSPYVRFYLHPDRELNAQLDAAESRAQALKRLEAEMLAQYSEGASPSDHKRRGAVWYALSIVPLIDAFVHGSTETSVLGLPNDGAVDWAPDAAMIELPTEVLAGGELQRRAAPALPEAATAMLRSHAAFEDAVARALAGTRSQDDVRERRSDLVAALATNPLVPDKNVAARLVERILESSPA